MIDAYNTALFYSINGIHEGAWYDKFMLLGTALGDYKLFPIYFIIIGSIAYFTLSRHKETLPSSDYAQYRKRWIKVLSVLVITYLCDVAFVALLKSYLHHPRPFIILPEGTVNILEAVRKAETPFASFPSGHSAFAMLMVAGLWPMLGRAGKAIGCFYVAWVGFSRIALGVHFPADVIGSFALAFVAVQCIGITRNLCESKRL